VVDREAEDYHLEGISLLAASLAPVVKHVAEVVKVAQVARLGWGEEAQNKCVRCMQWWCSVLFL
jgi:hypothetical protein